ncbi:MAG: FAD-dependent oxidoreductase [Candidatus Omnitrophota bacterium]
MPEIVIIGNSAAGFSCCQALLAERGGNGITVISEESFPAYNRNLLLGYFGGGIKEEELFLCRQEYYQANNVKLLKESRVALLETKKQRLILKDNSKINYDYLVIASGSRPRLPDIPGITKDGVRVFYSLEDAKIIKQRLVISGTVALFGESVLCAELAASEALRGKEAKIIARGKPEAFSACENHEWLEGLEIVEIIGEGSELRAIKLNNGKAIGVYLVIYAGAQLAASEFLKGSDIRTENGSILVNDQMRASLDNVFACGSVSKKDNYAPQSKTWDDAVREGVLAAESLIKIFKRESNICQQTS